ncbi:hypothetical protein FJ964_11475, partial [Mesorhizobium sp. B2-3-2]
MAEGITRRPPLPCRASPPQGGRSAAIAAFANYFRCRSERSAKAANLPPRGPVALLGSERKRRSKGQCGVPFGAG